MPGTIFILTVLKLTSDKQFLQKPGPNDFRAILLFRVVLFCKISTPNGHKATIIAGL